MSASRIAARALGPCVLFVLTKTACHVDGDAVATMMTTGTIGTTGTSTSSGSDGGDISTTTTASTGTADESGTSTDPTGGDPEVCAAITRDPGCGEPGAAPEGPFEVTQVSLPETFDLANACPCYRLDTPPDFEIFAPGGWPTTPTTAPLAVLAHGNGFNAGLYSNLIELLVSMGFVVVNVDVGVDGVGQNDRDEDATCAFEAMWAAFGDSLRCEVILVGHSSGAGDLLDLADQSGQEPRASILRPFDLRGYVMLAAGNPSFPATLDLTAAPPAAALFFGSTTDGQIGGRPGEHFDQLAPETDAAGYSAPRAVVWVDGTTHDGFTDLGGTGRALAALQGYIPEFIRSQVFNGNDDLWWSYATTEAWPAEVLDDTLWAALEPYSLHADVDCSIVGAVCDDTPGCASTPGGVCIDEPRIKNMIAPPSQYRHQVEFFEQIDGAEIDDTPDDMTLDVDAAEEITSGLGISRAVDSRILGVEYGAPDQVGELRIPVPANIEVGEMTHLSLRTGNVLELGDVCHAVSDEPVRFDVSLARGGGIDRSVALSTGRLTQQYHNDPDGSSCPSVQAMQTVRFNIGEWREFGTDEIDEIILTFDEPVDPARVIIDTIEFTDSPLDLVEDLPPCGFTGGGDGSGMWRCEIDELTVTEVSCSAEPVGSPRACDPGDIETTAVDPPLVVLPGGS